MALSPARQTATDQLFGPLLQRSPNLAAESRLGKLRLFTLHQLSIEPGGTRGNNLAFERQAGKRSHLQIERSAVLRIIGASAVKVILGYIPPTIGQPLDNSAPTSQRFQPAHMRLDQCFRIRGIGARKLEPMALGIVDATICLRQTRYRLVRSPALRSSDRDDPALRHVRDRIETPDPQVMRTAIDTVDDEVGRAFQLVVQALLDHAADDRLLRRDRRVEDRKIGRGTILTLCRKGALHRPDDVAADAELAQTRLRFFCEQPSGWADSTGQAHTFELL